MTEESVRHANLIFDYWLNNYKNHKDYDIADGNLVYLPTNEILCTEQEFRQISESFNEQTTTD